MASSWAKESGPLRLGIRRTCDSPIHTSLDQFRLRRTSAPDVDTPAAPNSSIALSSPSRATTTVSTTRARHGTEGPPPFRTHAQERASALDVRRPDRPYAYLEPPNARLHGRPPRSRPPGRQPLPRGFAS